MKIQVVTPGKFVAEVVEFSTGHVVRRTEPGSERRAERIESGIERNINHERFYTRVQPFRAKMSKVWS